jgi:hypothetical protein
MRFKRTVCIVVLLFVSGSVVVLGIELSTTRLSAEYGQPALDYRVSSRAPRGRTEILLLPKQACFHLHLCPISCVVRSVRTAGFEPAISRSPTWRDNQASPRSDHVHVVSSPYGNRTHIAALKGRYPEPIDERAVLCALVERKVGREVLEPSSAVLQTAAIPSQLPAQVVVRARKNPVSLALVTPGSK